MTSLEIPSFVTAILAQEMTDSNARLLKRISKDYNISYETLFKDYLSESVDIISSHLEKITIKKVSQRPPIAEEDRCHARTWTAGAVGQCKKKSSKDGSSLCTLHTRKEVLGQLKYGRIDNPVPEDLELKIAKRRIKKEKMV